MATVEVNVKPTDLKIEALNRAGVTKSYDDSDESEGKGFSLQRLILAHGGELGERSLFYFELSASVVSKLAPERIDERAK